MREDVVLVDQLLEEHGSIAQEMQTLEKVGNDVDALAGLDAMKGDFMPGRLDQGQGLVRLEGLLDKISRGLEEHFRREETGLRAVFARHGDNELTAGLSSLLEEHEELRNRLAHARKQVAELIGGGLSRQLWEAGAHDMRAHLSRTRQLVEAHAEAEQRLFQRMKKHLAAGAMGEGD